MPVFPVSFLIAPPFPLGGIQKVDAGVLAGPEQGRAGEVSRWAPGQEVPLLEFPNQARSLGLGAGTQFPTQL